jgi:hypothetical protein
MDAPPDAPTPPNEPKPPPEATADISAVRHAIFGELIDKATFAKAIKRSKRTVDRLVKQRMPVVPFIGRDWIDPPAAHAWIMAHAKTRDRAPRRPGRPPRKRCV